MNTDTPLLVLFVLCSIGCGGRGTDPPPASPRENAADNETSPPEEAEAPDNPAIGSPQGQLTPYVFEYLIQYKHARATATDDSGRDAAVIPP